MAQINEYLKIAIRNLKARSLRSWLTILGIIIGVFLIVSLLTLSEGLKMTIMQQLRMMGKDVLMVFPGELSDIMTTIFGGMKLTEEDLKVIKKVEGAELVIPMAWKGEMMRYEGKAKVVLLYGYPRKEAQELFKTDLGWSLAEGDWPSPGKREIIVGNLVPKEFFPGMKPGTKAYIKGREFLVTGVLKSLGSKQDDSMVGLDLEIFREITGERKGAQFALVKIKSGFAPEKMAEKIKNTLETTQKRKREKETLPFSVLTNEKAGSIAGNILRMIQVVVFAFASVAILVGGIGIMNTMYTAVRERTREIGIMKAIGARNSAILSIFLIEAGIIGFVGGIGGTILGIIFAKAIETYGQVHPIFYFSASITPGLIVFGLVFSFLVGCLAGFFPAKQAAKLKPVDALRYE